MQTKYSFKVVEGNPRDVGWNDKAVFYRIQIHRRAAPAPSFGADADGAAALPQESGKSDAFEQPICTTERRFSEFYDFYMLVMSMYHNSQLKSHIPPPPGKTAQKDLGDVFIKERCGLLNEFMKKMESFPGILEIPGCEEFLGLNQI